ncbi:MAG: hypothetical protein D4R73_06715 [Deltaproteobacteria bacterium]|nr:MAG: hypothetical protein D4R73_06715 [Deltaproteobacteria bacterium]
MNDKPHTEVIDIIFQNFRDYHISLWEELSAEHYRLLSKSNNLIFGRESPQLSSTYREEHVSSWLY